jgi:hypothetical protein
MARIAIGERPSNSVPFSYCLSVIVIGFYNLFVSRLGAGTTFAGFHRKYSRRRQLMPSGCWRTRHILNHPAHFQMVTT